MTQVVRYGRMLEARIDGIRVRVRIEWDQSGSLVGGTLVVRCTGVHSELEIHSPESPALIASVVHNAKAGCFAEAAMREAVEVSSDVRVNGSTFEYQAYPKRPPRRKGGPRANS